MNNYINSLPEKAKQWKRVLETQRPIAATGKFLTEKDRDGRDVPVFDSSGRAVPAPEPGTVGWLIGQLARFPASWRVSRYGDETVEEVLYRCGRYNDTDHEREGEIRPGEDHVALW